MLGDRRLGVFEITLPLLRERPDDILVLAEAFLDEIERAVILCEGGLITGEHLPITLTGAPKPRAGGAPRHPMPWRPPRRRSPSRPRA